VHRPKLEASHSAVRALSVSAYNRGCMWHVSAPHRPCIGHRTDYSLHENARISGLASADFEGVFCTQLQAVAPPAFFTRGSATASRVGQTRHALGGVLVDALGADRSRCPTALRDWGVAGLSFCIVGLRDVS